MVSATLAAPTIPLYLAAGAISILAAPWILRLPQVATTLLIGSLVFGQLLRIPLPGQGGGMLLSDGAVLGVLGAAILWAKFYKAPENTTVKSIGLLFLPFSMWGLLTLFLHAPELGARNTLIAGAYWARLATQLAMIPALFILLSDQKTHTATKKVIIASTIVIIGAGYMQLGTAPSLSGSGGWDPHQNRLISTWLDPNFVGAFLAIMIPWGVTIKSLKARGVFMAMAGTALVLTQSRSALIALGVSLVLCSPMIVIRMLANPSRAKIIGIMALIAMSILGSAGAVIIMKDRIEGLATLDPTVTLRAQALTKVWRLAEENVVGGTGYNAYQFAALREGIIGDFTVHSRAGADNSMLTLWVTTGIPGVILFSIPWMVLLVICFHRWMQRQHTPSLGAATAIVTLGVHAQFVNSFLYSHLLITLISIVAVAMTDPALQKKALNKARKA